VISPSRPPELPRALLRELNRLAARRARADMDATWRRHQLALHAQALDLLLAGRSPAAVIDELRQAA
jgi:hypothetical protein